MIMKIPHDHAPPGRAPRVSPRTGNTHHFSNGVGLRPRLAAAQGGAAVSWLAAGADESPGAATSMT